MTFGEIQIGQRFFHLDPDEKEWFYWRKLDDTHAQPSTPLGQDHGRPKIFFRTEPVRRDL